MEFVVLVDEKDREIGTEEKIRAHENGGKLHRAFSTFVFNSRGQMLLQRRACTKYHFGSLWSNTCCSHPRPGEKLEDAVHRRLKEEMGFDTELREVTSMIYRARFSNGLTEWEFDHAFLGFFDGNPEVNSEEVEEFKWVGMEELRRDVRKSGEKYTPWFKIFLEKIDFGKEIQIVF